MKEQRGIACSVKELLEESLKSKGISLHLRHASRALRSGSKRSSMRGRGMEFLESRPYVVQDEIRSLDWKVSARLGHLYTKVFTEEKDRPIYLAVDQSSSMFFGSKVCVKSVMAARVSAVLAGAAVNSQDQLGGMIFNESASVKLSFSTGKKSLARLFGALTLSSKSLMNSSSKEVVVDWHSHLKAIRNSLHTGSSLFLISDFWDLEASVKPILYALRKKADIFAIRIVDPLESKVPKLGKVGISFKGETMVFDSSNEIIRREYSTYWQDRDNQLKEIFFGLNIPFVSVATNDNVLTKLNQLFGR